MQSVSDILLSLSLKYKGDWEDIYSAIRKKEFINVEEQISLKSKLTSNYITILDKEYPEPLKAIYKPPFVLYYYGNLDLLKEERKITVVGSRSHSEYGKMCTVRLVEDLLDDGYVIISGLAKGIDTIAHQVTTDLNGKAVAILGSGIDNCYPKENKKLYDLIKEKGLIMSEYPMNEMPSKNNFPKRNRLLASLGNAVLVPEFKISSGTSITINLALSLGKNVFSPPHPLGDGCANNTLLKDGAILVENGSDIIFELEGKN